MQTTNRTSIEDFTSLFDQNTKRAETVVCDWDAVVQLIEEAWFMNLLHLKLTNPTHKLALTIDFSKFTEEDGSISHRKIISRPHYYLTDWLAYDGEKLDQESFDEFMKLYTDDLSFYSRSPFLIMFHGIYRLATEKFCKKIVFLSHTANNEMIKDVRKEHLFNKIFLDTTRAAKFSANVQLVHLQPNLKKHDWIKENCPDYTMFIDDRLDIIEGVIDNTDSEGKTFCMPIMGYNVGRAAKDPTILDKLRKIEFISYDQQIITNLKPTDFFEKDEDFFLKI